MEPHANPNPNPDPDLRYPVGRFHRPERLSPEERREAIDAIAETPAALREAVAGLSEEQLDTPYRPGGWTVRQVVHHVPESHMNAYVRFKLGLTEDTPTIRPYLEDRWSEQPDQARQTKVNSAAGPCPWGAAVDVIVVSHHKGPLGAARSLRGSSFDGLG